MPKGSRGGSKASSGGIGGFKSGNLAQGESVFVAFESTKLFPEGTPVVTVDSNGDYQYKGFIPNPDISIDTKSAEYKQALSGYNINAQFKSDGSVEVKKGGLFTRKTTFKSVDDFQKEANSRIDRRKAYYDSEIKSTLSGNISQLSAENIKSTIKSNPPAQAISKIQKDFSETISRSKMYSHAGADMKQRLNTAIEKQKKRK